MDTNRENTHLIDAVTLLRSLPKSFYRKLQRISEFVGKTPERVLSEVIDQYQILSGDLSKAPKEYLRAAVQEYYRRVVKRTNKTMTPEQRSERARNAALAKAQIAKEKKEKLSG